MVITNTSSASRSPRTSLGLVLVLAAVASSVTACTGFGANEGAASASHPANDPNGGPSAGGDATKAPPVTGTPDASQLNETLGVFVAPNGSASGVGSRMQPLASIQAGIDLGKRTGKRVYVCTGTFKESLAIADSISIIGGLDCKSPNEWKVGAARTRVEATASPAIVARNITTATRIEGFEILAPNAAEPGGSSIGLLADHASALTIASSKITAGDAAKGDDGAEGIQLVQMGTITGADAIGADQCYLGVCDYDPVLSAFTKPASNRGGKSVCSGAAGHDGEDGGQGGSSGLTTVWADFLSGKNQLVTYRGFSPELGEVRGGGQASAGTAGVNAPNVGSFSGEGYAATSGSQGGDGAPGKAGSGGNGNVTLSNPNSYAVSSVFRGTTGAGGGAGGCPGLAGTPGGGGGASVAALLVESPIKLDSVELIGGRGGDAGLGTFGSIPTPGGAAGANLWAPQVPSSSGRAGSDGGVAGISGNGASGPSVGIAHVGPAPTLSGTAKAVAGQGGAAIDERSRTDNLGNTKTIPASPAGLAKEVLAL